MGKSRKPTVKGKNKYRTKAFILFPFYCIPFILLWIFINICSHKTIKLNEKDVVLYKNPAVACIYSQSA